MVAEDGASEKSARQKEVTEREKTGRRLMRKSCGMSPTLNQDRTKGTETERQTDVLFQEADEGLEEESQCSQYAHRHKHPQEDPVDDHCDVLPVILYLGMRRMRF